MSKIGERIRFLRKKNFMNQEELALCLREKYGLKTERAMISKWETGFQSPAIEALVAISKIFGVSLDYIACAKESDSEMNRDYVPLYDKDMENAAKLIVKSKDIDADFCVVAEKENKILGIKAGDCVFGKKNFDLENDTSVIVLLEDSVRVKTWYSYDRKGILAGDGEKPVFLQDKGNVKILGKAVFMQRNI